MTVLMATRPISHNWNSKNHKIAITFEAHSQKGNMLLSNSNFVIFAVVVVWCRSCHRYRLF